MWHTNMHQSIVNVITVVYQQADFPGQNFRNCQKIPSKNHRLVNGIIFLVQMTGKKIKANFLVKWIKPTFHKTMSFEDSLPTEQQKCNKTPSSDHQDSFQMCRIWKQMLNAPSLAL